MFLPEVNAAVMELAEGKQKGFSVNTIGGTLQSYLSSLKEPVDWVTNSR
jgi:hypothetical protein